MSTNTLLAVGLAICVLAALLMITDIVSVEWGAVIGMIGVGVIGTSAAKRKGTTSSP